MAAWEASSSSTASRAGVNTRGAKLFSSELVGERLVVDEAIFSCRADGPFVKAFSLQGAALDALDLCGHQSGTVLEILRAVLRPDFELSMVRGQSLKMLLLPVGKCGIAGRRMSKRAIEMILRRFKDGREGPEEPLGFGGCIERRLIVPRKEACLQLSDPVPALGQPRCRDACKMALHTGLVIEGAKLFGQTPQGPD
jgi:hypothetical protein